MRIAATIVLIAAVLAVPTAAVGAAAVDPRPAEQHLRFDAEYLRAAHRGIAAQIAGARVALRRGLGGADRDLAQLIELQEGRLQEELATLAGAQGTALDDGIDDEAWEGLNLLMQADAKDLAVLFVRYQADRLHRTVDIFDAAARAAQTVAVRQFMTGNLPVVQAHLAQAEALGTRHGVVLGDR